MQDNFEKYHTLRKKYKEFKYNNYSYSIDGSLVLVEFNFEISGLVTFNPRWEFELSTEILDYKKSVVDKIVFSLGLAELVSYWKITCSHNIKIECGALDVDHIRWWKKLYRKGLGEFFYTNGIQPKEDFVNIICDINENEGKKANCLCNDNLSTNFTNTRVLIPIGGGKDSAVTLELLKGSADRFCYIINPRGATLETIKAGNIGNDRVIIAKRSLDSNMFKLNQQGFLNGHTPFSAIVAFSSLLVASLSDISYIALSNESSANESTVANTDVNHQYSKSYEFERDFINYEAKYLNSGVAYFSFLRPFTEIKIAWLFSKLTAYHPVFKSCNVGSKQDIWCGHCPKCLFVYIILSPFLADHQLKDIFGDNLLDHLALETDFLKLIGVSPEKPFECVGSRDEVNAAIRETIRQYEANKTALPALLSIYKDKYYKDNALTLARFLKAFDENNFVPVCFKDILMRC